LPTHLPLTKSEQKILKLVRRKIRNKKSANLSRERKKKYMNGLEKRIDICTKENEILHKTIKNLKHQNMELFTKMKQLQSHLNSLITKNKKASTVVLFISFFMTFYAYPYLDMSDMGVVSTGTNGINTPNMQPHYSRTLLSISNNNNMDVYLERSTNHDTEPSQFFKNNKKEKDNFFLFT
jgi:hypothetical protein